jgi:putative ABC transport system permease protein
MPEWNEGIRKRLARLKLEPAREAAIIEELSQHLEDCYKESLAGGATEAEAERRTLAQLSESEKLQQELRRVERQVAQEPIALGANRRTNMIAGLWQDMRYGARMLIKQPGFTLIAVLMLALGIGANTAIFSVVNATLLRPLPYAQPNRVVAIWEGRGQPGSTQGGVLPRNFQLWREQSRSFSDLALARGFNYRLAEAQEAGAGAGQEVTPNLFALLGVSALRGRPLAPGDENAGVRPVVLSHRLWRAGFGGDESIVGRAIRLNGAAATVVGIMPPHFVFPPRVSLAAAGAARDCDLWVPMAIDQGRLQTSVKSYLAFGRLREGVTLAQAQNEMNAFAPRLAEIDQSSNDQLSIHLGSLPELTTREARPALAALLGVVAFILLIACANVANLLLARAVARSREVAIRGALGATRSRVLRQILAECSLLGLLGGLAGLSLAYGGLKLLSSVAVMQSPHPVKIDLPALGFTLALSLVTSLLFGAGAAWQMAKGAICGSMQEAGRTGAGGVRLGRARNGLAVAQVALSLMLLLGAGLLIRTLWKLMRVDPGFRAAGVLTMDIRLPGTKYPRAGVAAAYTEILERLSRLAGVVSTGATQLLPILRDPVADSFQIEGRPMSFPGDLLPAEYRVVTPGYFAAMRIPLVEGRFLSDSDTETSQPVVVISERLAQLYFPQGSPLGRRITFSDPKTGPWHVIVGVVRDIRNWGLAADPTPETYISFRQNPKPIMTLVIRTESDPLLLAPSARAELRAFDKELAPERVATMEEILSRSLMQRRLNLAIIGSLAALAVVLAAFGLYSLIAYTVAQRKHEIGVRLALGAQRRDILRLVLWQGFKLVAVGVALGWAGATAATRALRSMLFGVSPTDPLTFVATTLLLALVALLACWFPARRSARVDPLEALRQE